MEGVIFTFKPQFSIEFCPEGEGIFRKNEIRIGENSNGVIRGDYTKSLTSIAKN